MVNCNECDKKLGILKGYHHPALGKRFLICGKCYTKVEEDMERWRKFCFLDSLNLELSKSDIQDKWNKNLSKNISSQKWFNDLWIKLDKSKSNLNINEDFVKLRNRRRYNEKNNWN